MYKIADSLNKHPQFPRINCDVHGLLFYLYECVCDNYAYQKNNRHFISFEYEHICENEANELQCDFIRICNSIDSHTQEWQQNDFYTIVVYYAPKYNE